jgi:hypothetical protein
MFKFLRRDMLLLLAVAAVLFSLTYAVGFVYEPSYTPVESQVAFLDAEHTPRKQAAAGRVWKQYIFEKTLGLDASAAKEPVALGVGRAGEIYLLDWADFRVKMFSPDGKLLKTFGEGKGTGEGGFVNPTALSVRPDGELWVCDPQQHLIRRYGPDGGVRAFNPQTAAVRVASVGDKMVTVALADDGLFEVYDLSGNRLGSFGEFIKDQHSKDLTLQGNVVGDEESGGFIYAGRFMPIIAGYGVDGRQRFVVQPVDGGGGETPTSLTLAGRQKRNPRARSVARTLSIDGDKLYVLSGSKDPAVGDRGGQVIDAYDKRDGNYLFSMKLPLACAEAVVRGDHVYALPRGGSVRVWRFRQGA